MKWVRRIPLICAGLYLLAVAANGAYVIYRAEFAPANSEFAAFGLVVLTLPWSFFLDALLRDEPEGGRSVFLLVGRFMLYGLANAAIIWAAVALVWRLAGISGRPAA